MTDELPLVRESTPPPPKCPAWCTDDHAEDNADEFGRQHWAKVGEVLSETGIYFSVFLSGWDSAPQYLQPRWKRDRTLIKVSTAAGTVNLRSGREVAQALLLAKVMHPGTAELVREAARLAGMRLPKGQT